MKIYIKLSLSSLIAMLAAGAIAQQKSERELEKEVLGNQSTPRSKPEDSQEDETPDSSTENLDQSKLKAVEEAVTGPSQIPFEQILVVQCRYIHKGGRHEISPLSIGLQPADSFRLQLQWSFSYIYHLNEQIGLELLHAAFITNYSHGLDQTILKSVGLDTDRIEPVWVLGSSLQWTPFEAKAATLDSIHHFEGYLLGGGGVTRLEDSYVGMVMWGGGFRMFLSKYALLKAEVRDYVDFNSQRNNRFNFLLGASVLVGSIEDRPGEAR